MTRINQYLPDLTPVGRGDDEDEGLFSRDFNGQLVRLDTPTLSDYERRATVWIDAEPVEVPVAEPLKDAQGNIVVKIDGSTTPRYTTVYDAAVALCVKNGQARNPIPILCHQPHMTPVAVCRICTVLVAQEVDAKESGAGTEAKKKRLKTERRLTPACQRVVKDGMHVFTMNAKHREGYITDEKQVEAAVAEVRRAVEVVHELLTADHLKPAPPPAPAQDLEPFNELRQLASGYNLLKSRFEALKKHPPRPSSPPGQKARPLPEHKLIDRSSPVFLVDHTACILCDRCSRACDEVKKNNIIGRTGKGAAAAIGFDLDVPMGKSGCVQCGECMVSCPTSAITFKPVGKVKVGSDEQKRPSFWTKLTLKGKSAEPPPDIVDVPAHELIGGKEPLLAGVPPKFLLWQEGLVRRRRVRKDEMLCRHGEPGHSAFFIKRGTFTVVVWPQDGKGEPTRLPRDADDLILGEMACLSGTPRTADIVASEDGEVLEVRRNVLDRIMRSPEQREHFQKIFRTRALQEALRSSQLFQGLPPVDYQKCADFLRDRLTFVRVNPGQMIFRQGEWADALYLVRLGHVRVDIGATGREANVLFRAPGTVIGEIGLLAIERSDVPRTTEERQRLIEKLNTQLGEALDVSDEQLPAALAAGKRTATCSALDHLEMARISRDIFLQMVRKFPGVRRRLIELAVGRLGGDNDSGIVGDFAMREYVKQGLYQAQSLLAIDLDKCTRCDECVRACIGQHGEDSHGLEFTRLKRDGERFGKFLVASSCRSCKDAYCMIGCPVDSIHRGKHLQIVIEDHCIGCGLCERNCPYGNIWMVENQKNPIEMADPEHPGKIDWKARPKAATCDLCDADGKEDNPVPRCVYACPHDAAHRMTGEQLRALVASEPSEKQ